MMMMAGMVVTVVVMMATVQCGGRLVRIVMVIRDDDAQDSL